MRRLALALGALMLLVGCSTSVIKLRHPDGRSATCGDSYAGGYHHFAAAARDRDCVRDYQRQGMSGCPTKPGPCITNYVGGAVQHMGEIEHGRPR